MWWLRLVLSVVVFFSRIHSTAVLYSCVSHSTAYSTYRLLPPHRITALPQLSPAPLAFDFGFPIVKEDTDDKRLFTFDIDLPL